MEQDDSIDIFAKIKSRQLFALIWYSTLGIVLPSILLFNVFTALSSIGGSPFHLGDQEVNGVNGFFLSLVVSAGFVLKWCLVGGVAMILGWKLARIARTNFGKPRT